ncbi:sensor histidine kinase [Actinacidiphila rubida]|uniref:histidine kinase n=1 Tax=Actinacidiphila rubida TaxID=310780 RepID=A0A1H8PVS7_9ACTN|nr:HAMP domain-containing sensor histidine kinase [Actinacidiphila rubida]SEO45774.1 Signal transduction histidine kinase [Actinacidiphila rubida]
MNGPRTGRRIGLRTVRTRVTAVAGLALTIAVTLGLVILYLLQTGSAQRTVDDQLRTYAAQVAQSGQGGTWPHPLRGSALDADAQAQVIASDGTVLASTPPLAGKGPVYTLPAGAAAPLRQPAADAAVSGEARAIGTRVVVHGASVTIIAVTSTELLSQINETFARLLLVGVPGILLLACSTVWLVVGRALRPVEGIRRTVTAISAADLARRVPDPGTHDEVGDLARTMNDMLRRLEDSAARQRRFVADASHELRSPLAVIRTTLEVGLAHEHVAPWPDIARRAVRQSQRLETLAEELLALARGDDRQPARRLPVVLGELVDDARTSTPDFGIAITVEPASSTAVVIGAPDDLSRLLRNVLGNAVRYARHRVVIRITETPDDRVRIEIEDDGPGVPEEDRERVFDRFVRLDTSRSRDGGSSGLGLSIARAIATQHGGTVMLDRATGGGALAVVTLPCSPVAGQQQRENGGGGAGQGEPAAGGLGQVPGQ